MQKKFEQNIEQAFQQFTIQPSPQVWAEVEAALHPQKKRRIAAWWWFAIATLVMGSAALGLFTLNKKDSKTNIVKANLETKKGINSINHSQSSVASVNVKSLSDNKLTQKNENTKNKIFAIKSFSSINKKEKKQAFLRTGNSSNNQLIVSTTESYNTAIDNSSAIQKSNQPKTPNDIQIQADSVKRETTVGKKPIVDSLQKAAPNITSKKKTTSAWQKFFLIEAGSFTEKAINKSNEQVVMADALSFITGVGNMANINNSPLYLPNTGFIAKAGLVFSRKIDNHWYIKTGLTYQYIQTSQKTGNKIDSISNPYYEKGNINTVTNHLHFFNIPVGIQYHFSSVKSYHYFIGSGLNLQYLFSKKWLLADERVKGYSYNKKLPFTFQTSFNLNAGIAFKNEAQLSLQLYSPVGLFYKNNSIKRSYWQTGLQLLYPIKHHQLK